MIVKFYIESLRCFASKTLSNFCAFFALGVLSLNEFFSNKLSVHFSFEAHGPDFDGGVFRRRKKRSALLDFSYKYWIHSTKCVVGLNLTEAILYL